MRTGIIPFAEILTHRLPRVQAGGHSAGSGGRDPMQRVTITIDDKANGGDADPTCRTAGNDSRFD